MCECDPNEVPHPWVVAEERSCASAALAKAEEDCDSVQCECKCVCVLRAQQDRRPDHDVGTTPSVTGSAELDSKVDRGLDEGIKASLLNLKGWRGYNNPWMAEGEKEEEYQFINLLSNPERYTGYSGDHAHQIW